MNEKINLRQLSDRLPADVFGIDAEKRTQIVSEIFALIAETLESGESVAVKGLGVFALTGDKDSPVIFEPDRAFVAIANAPFDAFSPVALPDVVTESDLAVVGEEAEEAGFSDASDALDASDTSDASDASDASDTSDTSDEAAHEAQPHAEPALDSEPEPVPAAPLTEATPIAEVTPIAEQESEPVPAAPVAEVTPIAEQESKNEYIPHVEAAQETEGSRFGVGYFWGLLTGLLVGAILFMIYVLITTSSEPLSTYEIEDEAAAAAITAIE